MSPDARGITGFYCISKHHRRVVKLEDIAKNTGKIRLDISLKDAFSDVNTNCRPPNNFNMNFKYHS
jgi:hypothetical protein